jgi:hypothetical protein
MRIVGAAAVQLTFVLYLIGSVSQSWSALS